MYRHDASTDVFVTSNRYSYLSRMGEDGDRWIIRTPVYSIDRKLRIDVLKPRLLDVVERNDALRLTLNSHRGAWMQRIGPPAVDLEHFVHSSDLGDEDYADFLDHILGSIRASMSLVSRNLVFAAIEDRGGTQYHLVALVHHVLMDGIALGRFEREIAEAVGERSDGPVAVARGSYRDYCLSYDRRCRSMLEASTNYWLDLPWTRAGRIPGLGGVQPDEMDQKWSLETRLAYSASSFAEARQDAVRARQGSIAALLLTSFAEAYGTWAAADHLLLGLVYHNRPSDMPEFAETIGWVSETVPLLLPTRGRIANRLEDADRQLGMLRRFAANYGFNRYLSDAQAVREAFGVHPAPDISLNLAVGHRERAQGPRFGVYEHRPLPPAGRRVHLIAGGVRVKSNRLLISLDHSARALASSRIETLLYLFDEAINRALASMSCAPLVALEP